MAYSQQSWNTGDPITQEKMRKIEKGIYDAHVTADSSSNSVTNLNAALSELSTTVGNLASSIQQAQIDITAAQESTSAGTKAWTQIVPLIEFEADGTTIKKNLATRITTDESHINDNANLIATVQGWITDAQSVGGQVYDSINARFKNAESLAERIGEINRLITNVTNTANSTAQTISPTNGRSFADRLTSMDANQVPTRTLISIIEEIENAHVSAQNDTTYSNIDARLEADELSLNTHASQIGALDESRVKYTDVKNNFESSDTDKPLSAAKGKELKETIDGKVDTWTYLGEKTGTAEQNLPEGWKELLMQVNVTSANLVTYHIYNSQTEEYTNTALGAYGTSYAVGQISRTKAKISTVNWAGSDVTSTAKLYTYYR